MPELREHQRLQLARYEPPALTIQDIDPAVWRQARTELWVAWAELAVQAEREAARGRRLLGRRATNQMSLVFGLETETKAAMSAAVAAAACLETAGNNLVQFLPAAPQVRPAASRFIATVNSLYGPVIDDALTGRVKLLFKLRNDTMHYRSDWQSVDIHPVLGIRTTWVARTYSFEAAQGSVSTLVSVLRAVTKPGNSESDDAEFWAMHWRHLPGELELARPQRLPADVAERIRDR